MDCKPETNIGRPSIYQSIFCEILLEHFSQGYSYTSFPATLWEKGYRGNNGNPICIKTLYEWEQNFPEFAQCKKLGLALLEKALTQIGYKLVSGDFKGNATAYIWLTKNILKWRDSANENEKMEAPPRVFCFPDPAKSKENY